MSRNKFFSAIKIFVTLVTCYVVVDTVAINVILFGSGFEHRRIQKLLDGQVSATHVVEAAATWLFIGAADAAIFSFIPSTLISIYAATANSVSRTAFVTIGILVTVAQFMVFYIASRFWAGIKMYRDSEMILLVFCASLTCTSIIANILAWRFLKPISVIPTT